MPNNTFFTLKTNYISKLRIELKSILSEISSNKIKGILLSPLPLSLFSAILTVCVRGRGANFVASGRLAFPKRDLLSEGIAFLLKGAFLGVGGERSCFLLLPGDPVTQR